MPQSASPSNFNFWFIGSPTTLHWKSHDSSLWSVIKVNKHMMESFQIDLVPLQYHADNVCEATRYSIIVFARRYIVNLFFIPRTLIHVGAHPQGDGKLTKEDL